MLHSQILKHYRLTPPSNETCKHLKILLEFLRDNIVPQIKLAKDNLQKPKATVAFDDLWLLFKPGLDLYWKLPYEHFSDVATAGVLMGAKYGHHDHDDNDGDDDTLTVEYWCLQSDGQTLSRYLGSIDIDKYEGERQVTSLSVYPCRYLDSEDGGETRKALVERGRKMYKLLRGMPSQMWYDGYQYAMSKEVVGSFSASCFFQVLTLV